MVESSVKQNRVNNEQSSDLEMGNEGFLLEIGGTILGSIGKIVLAIGTVGLLLFVFTQIKALIGLSVIYTGVATVSAGLIGMVFSNKMSNGYWIEGLMVA